MIKAEFLIPQISSLGLVAYYKLWAGQINPVSLGPEVVTNGGFDADSDWEKEDAQWTIADGIATYTYATGGSSLSQSGILTIGTLYRLVYEVTANTTDGNLRLIDTTGGTITIPNGVGTHTIITSYTATGLIFRITLASTGAISLDNISVKEVLGRVFDYSLGGKPGTPTGTDIVPTYPGFSFNGTDDFIDIGNHDGLIRTVLLWVKPTGIGGNDYPIDLNGTDYLTIETGTLTKNGFAGGTTVLYTDGVAAATTITANWHLIAITDTSVVFAGDVDIGRIEGQGLFTGKIGDVMLFDKTLSAPDVKSIYELTKGRYS